MEKSFTVDWDSYESISLLGNKIKCRLGELNPNRISKKEKVRRELEICKKIYETNIKEVYFNSNLDEREIYYVYAHLDTSRPIAIGRQGKTTFAATLGMDFFPFYIGKGTGDRLSELNRNETHRKVRQKIESLGKKVKVIKIKDNLTELDALTLESKLIDIFGLIPHKGLLSNLDEGINKDNRREFYRKEFDQLTLLNRML